MAAKEFQDHGYGDLIEIQQRDVCKDGFGIVDAVNAGKYPKTAMLSFAHGLIPPQFSLIYQRHGMPLHRQNKHLNSIELARSVHSVLV